MDPATAAFYDFCLKLGVAGGALAALVYLVQWIFRVQLASFDRHITAVVEAIHGLGGRVDALEKNVGEIKEAVLGPHQLRVYDPGPSPDPGDDRRLLESLRALLADDAVTDEPPDRPNEVSE